MTVIERVRRFARRHDLWRPHTRVIAAVSGGSDSVALLLFLHDLHTRGELRLDAAAHLNHGIRPDADADEAFCRELAERLTIPFVAGRIDVPAEARRRRQSIELAARAVRRRFLDTVQRQRGADCVATAHTRDDQAETVLMRLLRGSGARGLGGMPPRAAHRIRPVLFATRIELQDELRRCGQPWREDATNLDLSHPRNRIRHELLPYLAQHFNPSVGRALARLAAIARADDAWLTRESAARSAVAVQRHDESVRLDLAALQRELPAMRRRIIHQALTDARRAGPAFDEVEAVLRVVEGQVRAVELAELRAEPSGAFVVLLPKGTPKPPPGFCLNLSVPGHVDLTQAGCSLTAEGPFAADEVERFAPATAAEPPTWRVVVAAEGLGDHLVVRSRRAGDRLRPLGLGGQKKLQDVLVDRKVARRERDLVPIVTDARGRIVWVAGHALSEEFRVTDDTKAVIILKLRRI